MIITSKFSIIILLSFVFIAKCYGAGGETFSCGLSDGYPPYQFQESDSSATGFDAEVLRLVFNRAQLQLELHQMNWVDVVGGLRFSPMLHCAGGMEITRGRKRYFDFTSPYYSRKSALFVLAENPDVTRLDDLVGKIVAGDKDSSLEAEIADSKMLGRLRIVQTKSKAASMKLMRDGKASAVIAPVEVGYYLADELGMEVRIVMLAESESPVSIAVKKGHQRLLRLLESALQQLLKEGEIDQLYEQWFPQAQ
ncbi:transporter substrate-binding domain-containing protein [Shewanella atlantica]|uniref:transporter substrate-binding domain-containing protein n=1 Tax=Shewanella atlantica TaxID=271099 RepID=UPI003736CEA9